MRAWSFPNPVVSPLGLSEDNFVTSLKKELLDAQANRGRVPSWSNRVQSLAGVKIVSEDDMSAEATDDWLGTCTVESFVEES